MLLLPVVGDKTAELLAEGLCCDATPLQGFGASSTSPRGSGMIIVVPHRSPLQAACRFWPRLRWSSAESTIIRRSIGSFFFTDCPPEGQNPPESARHDDVEQQSHGQPRRASALRHDQQLQVMGHAHYMSPVLPRAIIPTMPQALRALELCLLPAPRSRPPSRLIPSPSPSIASSHHPSSPPSSHRLSLPAQLDHHPPPIE